MKTYKPLAEASEIARHVLALLSPCFKSLHIAGSVRRGKKFVSDIELVGIPESTEAFVTRTQNLVHQRVIQKHDYGNPRNRWGEKYRGFDYEGMLIEVFTADEDNIGYISWLRTGPGDANTTVMTHMSRAWYPIRASDGYLWHVDYPHRETTGLPKDYRKLAKLKAEDENAVFTLLNIPPCAPASRCIDYYNWHMDNSDWTPPPIDVIPRYYTDVLPVQKKMF